MKKALQRHTAVAKPSPSPSRVWQIAIFGTFDVENYGDLLFPIIAEAELSERLGQIKLHRFSYHAKQAPAWPYAVTSLDDLPALAEHLDGVLIGGGFIIRFDKLVAHGYGPPNAQIHHPSGYWLTPALIALQHGIPLCWNAPGMHCNALPTWAEPLMQLAFGNSGHVRVRDSLSRQALLPYAGSSAIEVLPDTAFGLSRLLDRQHPSPAFESLREAAGLTGPYIVIHAIRGLEPVLQLIKQRPELFAAYQCLILPIGPVLGDQVSIIDGDLPRAIRLQAWPQPLLLAELIGQAQGVIGHSYHLAITALVFGVPIFSSADLSAGKYTALVEYPGLYALPAATELDPQWLLERLGRRAPSPAVQRAVDQLSVHWDQIASLVREGRTRSGVAVDRFWQGLPNQLEAAQDRETALQAQLDDRQQALDQSLHRLARAQQAVAETEYRAASEAAEWQLGNQGLQQQVDQLRTANREQQQQLEQLHTEHRRQHHQHQYQHEQWQREYTAHQQRLEKLQQQLSDAHTQRALEQQAQAVERAAAEHQTLALGTQLTQVQESAAEQSRLAHARQRALQNEFELLSERLRLTDQQLATLSRCNSLKITAPLRLLRRGFAQLTGHSR